MMSTALSNQVRTGPFSGRTRAELLPLLRAAQDELAAGGSQITSAGVNGNSFSRTPGLSLTERIRLLRNALAQVDPCMESDRSDMVVRFS